MENGNREINLEFIRDNTGERNRRLKSGLRSILEAADWMEGKTGQDSGEIKLYQVSFFIVLEASCLYERWLKPCVYLSVPPTGLNKILFRAMSIPVVFISGPNIMPGTQ